MNLDKALRAMQYTESWRNSVQAAALFAGQEYGEPFLQAMTLEFLDDLGYDPETLVVTVPEGIGEVLLAAAKAWRAPAIAEAEKVEDADLMLTVLETLTERVAGIEVALGI